MTTGFVITLIYASDLFFPFFFSFCIYKLQSPVYFVLAMYHALSSLSKYFCLTLSICIPNMHFIYYTPPPILIRLSVL